MFPFVFSFPPDPPLPPSRVSISHRGPFLVDLNLAPSPHATDLSFRLSSPLQVASRRRLSLRFVDPTTASAVGPSLRFQRSIAAIPATSNSASVLFFRVSPASTSCRPWWLLSNKVTDRSPLTSFCLSVADRGSAVRDCSDFNHTVIRGFFFCPNPAA